MMRGDPGTLSPISPAAISRKLPAVYARVPTGPGTASTGPNRGIAQPHPRSPQPLATTGEFFLLIITSFPECQGRGSRRMCGIQNSPREGHARCVFNIVFLYMQEFLHIRASTGWCHYFLNFYLCMYLFVCLFSNMLFFCF